MDALDSLYHKITIPILRAESSGYWQIKSSIDGVS